MKIAQDMAGYTLGGADLLRRAMGKKKPEEMAKQRETFVNGSTQQGIDPDISGYIFDLMEKFAGYGFNKSHSAAYALVSYQTAWLKAHYPSAFMAAVLSSDMDKTDKVVVFIEECRQMKLEIRSPDINCSEFRFTAQNDGSIQYGLGAIKGVGESAINEILDQRKVSGTFSSLRDLCRRIDGRKVTRRVLEALIRAGAFDCFDNNRAAQLTDLTDALRAAEQHGHMAQTGQDDLFGLFDEQPADTLISSAMQIEPWSEQERLNQEKLTLGLYLSGHPISHYEADIVHFITERLGPLTEKHDRSGNLEFSYGRRQDVKVIVAGLIVDFRTKQNKNGKRMAFATLDDRTGRLEVAIFSEAFDRYREILTKDTLLVAEGSLSWDDFAGQLRLSADSLMSIEQARVNYARRLVLNWQPKTDEHQAAFTLQELDNILSPYRGGNCRVFIEYRNDFAEGLIQLGEDWKIRPEDALLIELRKNLGTAGVAVNYT